ncbi:small secreted protein [Rhodocollybia butyracea]|uniref:Small secreted protein n=1 Tax=Rhodocollybia butyracea TaxID=206335 RepID=A0A9P5UFE1_9AGAR|nr:small secreted protein [Rhodocollybia butyracea]
MFKFVNLSFAVALVYYGIAAAAKTPVQVDNTTLWVNAIVGKKGVSTVECWGIQPPFAVSSQPGTVGNKLLQLGNLANASYTVFPTGPDVDSGLHNAPNAQWVALLAGQGNINFPDSPHTPNLTFNSGELIIAVDTPGTSAVGHRSVWVGGTIALQMPFAPGFVPAHKTVESACPRS